MNKRIAFRLDANKNVASGHMYRCISIAKECIRMGNDCLFFISADSITEPLETAGIKYVSLELKWNDWNYNTNNLIAELKKSAVDYVVVDSYHVTEEFFDELSRSFKVLYMDDICKTAYNIDASIHYSEWEGDSYLKDLYKGKKVKTFAGMQYTPLREEFRKLESDRERKYDLLITTGGTDTFHVTKLILERIIESQSLSELSVCAVFGMMNSDYDEVKTMCAGKGNIALYQNVKNMAELMQDSKYAVTAGGTTVYELMASCTPFVVFSFSDDQTIFGERLEKNGNSIFAGDMRYEGNRVIDVITEQIETFFKKDKEEINSVIEKNRKAIDGKGSVRIARILDRL